MEQKILKVGDVIQFNGKRYRAESEPTSRGCRGCVFGDVPSCPIQEDCNTNSVILKEVKETPRRHIELGVVKVEGDNVTFKIIEQTHREKEFSQQSDHHHFKASNGAELASGAFPAWKDGNHLLYCRGRACEEDDKELTCTASEFARISEAVTEYNATDGKGYEKPWPQTGDDYFYILENGALCSRIFYGDKYDHAMQDCGNFFRTSQEAEAAADKVRALLKELAAK
ncbi:hypothetical protein [uncultured Victivallis sp.]|uniref:hypothetical protein n=1 Tax=uncultured Victivallis sp. TaxID=354118 RepID=UPI002598B0AC|nr:hypothetical protein [uncultured Victivallis sp.]